jgi:adenylosuccinate lyase
VKQQGGRNDLLERVKKTEFFKASFPHMQSADKGPYTMKLTFFLQPVWNDIDSLVDPKLFIGNSPKIVEDYCNGEVAEKLARYKEFLGKASTAQLSI